VAYGLGSRFATRPHCIAHLPAWVGLQSYDWVEIWR